MAITSTRSVRRTAPHRADRGGAAVGTKHVRGDTCPMLDAVAVTIVLPLIAALMVLTGLGARRRGAGPPLSVVSGLAFPVAWVVWYLRNERPYSAR